MHIMKEQIKLMFFIYRKFNYCVLSCWLGV